MVKSSGAYRGIAGVKCGIEWRRFCGSRRRKMRLRDEVKWRALFAARLQS